MAYLNLSHFALDYLQSFEKDELRLIIQKTTCRQCQRQLFVMETTFTLLPDLQALRAEMKLVAEVVIVREEKFGVHKITGA